MTENEAIERIRKQACNDRFLSIHCDDSCLYGAEKCEWAHAIQALSEIQQYRAIGTVDEFKDLKEKDEPRELYGNEWNPVHVGDTVSGLCPVCMTKFVCITPRMYKANNYGYCGACGQKLDWQ